MKKEKKQVKKQSQCNENLSYIVEVRDKEGRIIQQTSAPSRSYVEQWNQLINIQAKQTSSTLTKTDGNTQSLNRHGWSLSVKAAIGFTSNGLRVGKGTTAVAIDDYALETPLEEGVGVDQLNHQIETFTTPTVDGSTCSFTTSRIFVNNSGTTITGIKEIGAYVRMSVYYGLGFRDVLPSEASVPDGGSITVTYTISATA